ncbi:Bacterial extracellular solute-binding protein, family 3 [Pseudodesulfovibrio hydrargyri]|uniref:Bacterial extracellular solute-binding protein, family 3 n=1 Tax=Pseudodesulfovibrio hydrargyri TaxID=2125990 RepID=A0A1J5MUP7_9BACT|nr:transporter substrate-binding domain-containing protein [Pseudodesulfovibrio hydrargyri]OIQ50341.1 Bacterial extracellular solute-binding protein, family 3 [Pseudodesulfovibrio hydrargyri]
MYDKESIPYRQVAAKTGQDGPGSPSGGETRATRRCTGGLRRASGPAAVVLACLLFFCSEGAGHARDLVLFITNENWPPYQINDSALKGKGVIVDMLGEIAPSLGLTLKVRVLPERRGWDMLEHGEVDIFPTAREWTENPDRYLWTAPLMLNEDILLFRAGSTLRYVSPASLEGLSVAAMEDFVYPALEPSFREGKIIRIDCGSPYNMLEMLDRSRVDAALVNRSETLWLFRNYPELHPERFRMDETPFDSAWYRFLLPRGRGWEQYIDRFNDRITTMKRDGTLNAILDRYR